MPILIIGYLMAGGELWSLDTLWWAIFGLIFHGIGFLQNNIFDLAVDKKDPNKQHFPLVRGDINVYHANLVQQIGLVVIALLGIALMNGNIVAWIIMLAAMGAGTLYNKVSKTSLTSTFWICLTFSPLFLFSYLSTGGEMDQTAWLIFFFINLQIAFQIGYSGYLKEIGSLEQINLLRKMGARVKDGIFEPKYTLIFGSLLRGATIILLVLIASELIEWILVLSFFAVSQVFVFMIMKRRKWERDKDLIRMSLVEALTYFTLPVAIGSIIGWDAVAFLIIFPLIWFVMWNRLIWGTKFTPKV